MSSKRTTESRKKLSVLSIAKKNSRHPGPATHVMQRSWSWLQQTFSSQVSGWMAFIIANPTPLFKRAITMDSSFNTHNLYDVTIGEKKPPQFKLHPLYTVGRYGCPKCVPTIYSPSRSAMSECSVATTPKTLNEKRQIKRGREREREGGRKEIEKEGVRENDKNQEEPCSKQQKIHQSMCIHTVSISKHISNNKSVTFVKGSTYMYSIVYLCILSKHQL